VISTSHCVAKSVVKPGHAEHVCYCLTPMRYAWDQYDAYFGAGRTGPLTRTLLRPVLAALARWDAATADRVDRYVAISQHVASRIRRYYNRDALVIYPPVDTTFYSPDGTETEAFLLIVSALVPYKRIELAIEASRRAGLPLRVVGNGPERDRLVRFADAQRAEVTFLGSLSDEDIRGLYRRSAAVLLPGEEDFGIVPVEAQACGRPVVALARGGALETVVDGVTGVLVGEPSAEAFGAGLRRAVQTRFDSAVIRQHAVKFDVSVFARSIQHAIAQHAITHA
jgi:glycosyltransferase involved in cell wall biosynthesis